MTRCSPAAEHLLEHDRRALTSPKTRLNTRRNTLGGLIEATQGRHLLPLGTKALHLATTKHFKLSDIREKLWSTPI